ncbi:MAG: glycosyltransferase family 2 protein [Bacteroidetes bacterium]|nr:glycosyltransferase family 2 protein [Bacteroidota bacterium]
MKSNIKNDVAFFAVIFNENENYLDLFFDSLKKQTYSNFDVVIVNDRYNNFEFLYDKYKELNIVELKYSSTPAKNREFGIKYIFEKNYKIVIFGDSDDYFANNRVQICINKLIYYDIVVNDISLFNDNGIGIKKYISNRIENNTEINLDFIKDKNIFGMTNTAIKINALENVNFDSELIAVDWYFFSILLLKNYKAIFTNETETYYRQYSNNTVGITNITNESISKEIMIKIKHYDLIRKEFKQFQSLYEEMIEFKKKVVNINFVEKLKKQNIKNPFWWEEIRLIK